MGLLGNMAYNPTSFTLNISTVGICQLVLIFKMLIAQHLELLDIFKGLTFSTLSDLGDLQCRDLAPQNRTQSLGPYII